MMEPALSDIARPNETRRDLWLKAMRPRTLMIALAPILVGAAHAHAVFGAIALTPVVAAACSALAIQIATNLANDAADGERGADGPHRIGPMRVTGAALMSAYDVRRGALVATLVAALFGLVAVVYGGLPILGIGLASIAAAWSYSYGPRPISATPLGEAFVLLFFGVAATVGVEYLAAGRVHALAFGFGVAIGLPAAAVLTVNNHRDRAQDATNGRRTLAILLGPTGAKSLYAIELIAASLLAAALVASVSTRGALLAAATLAPAVALAWRVAGMPITSELNGRLAATGAFQMLLAISIAIGLRL